MQFCMICGKLAPHLHGTWDCADIFAPYADKKSGRVAYYRYHEDCIAKELNARMACNGTLKKA